MLIHVLDVFIETGDKDGKASTHEEGTNVPRHLPQMLPIVPMVCLSISSVHKLYGLDTQHIWISLF